MSTPSDTYGFDPSRTGWREHPWAEYVDDLAAGRTANRFLDAAARARAPYDADMPVPNGNFPWRGNQHWQERILLNAASRSPNLVAALSAYEARLGQHTLSPDTSETLRDLRSGTLPVGQAQNGPGPSSDEVAHAAHLLRAGHLAAAARRAEMDLEVVKQYAFSGTHGEAWKRAQHLRPPGSNPSWGTPPTKAQKRADTRFLVTQMGQELRGALALIEPPDGGEVGRRQVAEFDRMAEKLLGKRKNGGRDAVTFYRAHADNPPPRLPPANAESEPTVSPPPQTDRTTEQVDQAATALAPGLPQAGSGRGKLRDGGGPSTQGTARTAESRTRQDTSSSSRTV